MILPNKNSQFEDDDNIDGVHPGLGFAINDINIKTEQQSGHFLLDMLTHNEINLDTPFQRSSDLWNPDVMSRFIESMMLRFPIPPFYFNVAYEDTDAKKPFWEVIDGLQRLSALQRFFLGDSDGIKLKLSGLDFFTELNGKTVEELPRHLKRNIESCQITMFVVYPNTPKEVKYRIFERVNTGGLQLNAQEIRHALNQGRAVKFLAVATEAGLRKNNIFIEPGRMKDQELALRCLAFHIFGPDKFPNSMKKFLDDALEELGKMPDFKVVNLIENFSSAVKFMQNLLGRTAFRRTDSHPVNRSLFDSYTYAVSTLSDNEKDEIMQKKEIAYQYYLESFEYPDYVKSITSATARAENINRRFYIAQSVLKRVLK